jgi:hypothetical protein
MRAGEKKKTRHLTRHEFQDYKVYLGTNRPRAGSNNIVGKAPNRRDQCFVKHFKAETGRQG